MTPEKLAKIRALAEDPRGDPATRQIAQEALKRFDSEDIVVDDRPRLHPGMQRANDDYLHRYMDLSAWKKSMSGNRTIITISSSGHPYQITLFAHKKTPTWGWVRKDMLTDDVEFSGRFTTQGEAHQAAWATLKTI